MDQTAPGPAAPAIVSARNLRKEYGPHIAVDGVSFAIRPGECFGFLGPNGAGKTTTLRMLMGVTPMTDGELTLFDLAMPDQARAIRTHMGVVPQTDNLDPDFTVEENLHVYATFFGLTGAALESRIEHLLAFAALTDRRRARTDALSGGMKRRLTIARALINNPDMVILDEPTTGLDPQARHIIWSRLAELRKRGTTLLLTTHYMEEAERLCDRLVIMDQGRILDQGSPRELVARHVEPEVIEIHGEPEELDSLRVNGDCRIESMGTSLYCYTTDSARQLERLQQARDITFMHRPSGLEDVFLKLTGRELRD